MSSPLHRQIIDLCGDSPDLQASASQALLAAGADAVPALVAALDDDSLGSPGHWRILRVLRELSPPGYDAIAASTVRRGLDRTDPVLVRAGLEALAACRTEDAAVNLIDMTRHPNQDWAMQAVLALSRNRSQRAIEHLASLLSHEDKSMRWSAVKAISASLPDSLRPLLRDRLTVEENEEIRQLIRSTLDNA